jgi:hypothetical protein
VHGGERDEQVIPRREPIDKLARWPPGGWSTCVAWRSNQYVLCFSLVIGSSGTRLEPGVSVGTGHMQMQPDEVIADKQCNGAVALAHHQIKGVSSR